MQVRFKKTHENAVMPKFGTQYSAGADLVAVSMVITEKYIQYHTGIAVEIPTGYVGLLFPRSSVSNYNMAMANCVGVIDSDYRGEIMLRYRQTKKNCIMKIEDDGTQTGIFADIYKEGDRVGQLVIVPYLQTEYVEVDSLDETVRGDGGYGSTGK